MAAAIYRTPRNSARCFTKMILFNLDNPTRKVTAFEPQFKDEKIMLGKVKRELSKVI
jgi:hypothetical protein